jgi:formyltetrahydrofolate deformylase
MENHILLIDGPDEKGLIYRITGVLFKENMNVICNDEFVENETNHFFMRCEFTGNGNHNCEIVVPELKKILPSGFNVIMQKQVKKQIVVFASKEHHCLADLLIRNAYNKFNANILAVISNHSDLRPLVEKFGLPFYCISAENMTRELHEAEVVKVIEQYHPDYMVLAKYMRILTPSFVQKYKNKIINIHHSFLPAFIGANPYEQAFKRGVKIIGATSHFVSENLDEGPIIMQEVIPVDHKFSVDMMRQAGQDAEILAFAKALKLVFEDRVFISRNKTVIFK